MEMIPPSTSPAAIEHAPGFLVAFHPNTLRLVAILIPEDGQKRFLDKGFEIAPYAPGGFRQVPGQMKVEPWPSEEEA